MLFVELITLTYTPSLVHRRGQQSANFECLLDAIRAINFTEVNLPVEFGRYTKRIRSCSVLPGHRKMRNVLPVILYLDSDPAQLSGSAKFEGASASLTQSLKKRSVHKICIFLRCLVCLFVYFLLMDERIYLNS